MTGPPRGESELLLYTAPDGAVKVGVLFRDETAWLTQKALAELFGVGVPAVNKHLKNIFESGELDPEATISKMEMVRNEGDRQVTRAVEFYNLDQTAAELIYSSADATKVFMGLTTWKSAPHGKILKSDVMVAKNYLSEAHIKELNRIVSAYLDLAENRAQRGILMKMADWATFLNGFLELSSYPILADKGKVSAIEAKLKAEAEYEIYRKRQDAEFVSDFDRVVEQTKRIEGGDPRRLGSPRATDTTTKPATSPRKPKKGNKP
jgi:hypothetical protein